MVPACILALLRLGCGPGLSISSWSRERGHRSVLSSRKHARLHPRPIALTRPQLTPGAGGLTADTWSAGTPKTHPFSPGPCLGFLRGGLLTRGWQRTDHCLENSLQAQPTCRGRGLHPTHPLTKWCPVWEGQSGHIHVLS